MENNDTQVVDRPYGPPSPPCPVCGDIDNHYPGCVIPKMDALRAQLDGERQRAQHWREAATLHEHNLVAFRNAVVHTTTNFHRGCRGGKREFLDELGLELPPLIYEATATITLRITSDDDEGLGYLDVQSMVENTVDFGDEIDLTSVHVSSVDITD